MSAAQSTAALAKERLFGVGGLRDEFTKLATGGRTSDSESREWSALDAGHRMAMLLLAGVDGDLGELAQRDWRELPPLEREAIKYEVRAAKAAFSRLMALSGRW